MRRLLEFWRLLNAPCSDMSALISRSMDERLTRRERFAAGLHLLYCRACARYRRQLRLIREATARFRAEVEGRSTDQPATAGEAAAGAPPDSTAAGPPSAPGLGLSESARDRIRNAMRER